MRRMHHSFKRIFHSFKFRFTIFKSSSPFLFETHACRTCVGICSRNSPNGSASFLPTFSVTCLADKLWSVSKKAPYTAALVMSSLLCSYLWLSTCLLKNHGPPIKTFWTSRWWKNWNRNVHKFASLIDTNWRTYACLVFPQHMHSPGSVCEETPNQTSPHLHNCNQHFPCFSTLLQKSQLQGAS